MVSHNSFLFSLNYILNIVLLISVECYPWASYVGSDDCVNTALIQNSWATQEEVATLQDTDKKTMLISGLNLRLDPETHSKPELGGREVASDLGGLCGLAALQHALASTIATLSMLRTMSFESIREMIGKEMDIPRHKVKDYNDEELLTEFNTCEYFLTFLMFYLFISFTFH